MTNREVLIQALQEKEYDTDLCAADYIACCNAKDCTYKGDGDTSMCAECKARWLNQEWES